MHIRARAAQRGAKAAVAVQATPLGSSGVPAAVALQAAPLVALPTAEDIALYEAYFGVHNEAGFVGAMSAKACLEEACGGALSNQVLARIWVLCDADGDGQLGQLEFYLAVHIVLHMAKERLAAVPHITPALLSHLNDALARSVTRAAPIVSGATGAVPAQTRSGGSTRRQWRSSVDSSPTRAPQPGPGPGRTA